jgi:hypothetical protein
MRNSRLVFVVIGFAWFLVSACFRDIPPPMGDEGGSCYPNHTCDADLVCSLSDICVQRSPDLCAGVTCANHGTCVADDVAWCDCDPGFHADGLSCVVGCIPTMNAYAACDNGDAYWFDGCGTRLALKQSCGIEGCTDSHCNNACPEGMVLVVSQGVCIDQYEATIFLNPDCTGPRYGGGAMADYPAGFPANVESSGCTDTCVSVSVVPQTTPLYACSVPAVIPSGYVSFFQAKRACENSSKLLCTELEWYAACSGPSAQAYPYGAAWQPVCNDANSPAGAAVPAGSSVGCEGGYPGIYDMIGNVDEWIDLCDAGSCRYSGGGYPSDTQNTRCGSPPGGMPPTSAPTFRGFRCCLSL